MKKILLIFCTIKLVSNDAYDADTSSSTISQRQSQSVVPLRRSSSNVSLTSIGSKHSQTSSVGELNTARILYETTISDDCTLPTQHLHRSWSAPALFRHNKSNNAFEQLQLEVQRVASKNNNLSLKLGSLQTVMSNLRDYPEGQLLIKATTAMLKNFYGQNVQAAEIHHAMSIIAGFKALYYTPSPERSKKITELSNIILAGAGAASLAALQSYTSIPSRGFSETLSNNAPQIAIATLIVGIISYIYYQLKNLLIKYKEEASNTSKVASSVEQINKDLTLVKAELRRLAIELKKQYEANNAREAVNQAQHAITHQEQSQHTRQISYLLRSDEQQDYRIEELTSEQTRIKALAQKALSLIEIDLVPLAHRILRNGPPLGGGEDDASGNTAAASSSSSS